MGIETTRGPGGQLVVNRQTDPQGDMQALADEIATVGNTYIGSRSDMDDLKLSGAAGGLRVGSVFRLVTNDLYVAKEYVWTGSNWRPFDARPRVWNFIRSGSGNDSWAANSFGSLVSTGSLKNMPPGDYLVQATALVSTVGPSIGFCRIEIPSTITSAKPADWRNDADGVVRPVPFLYGIEGFAGGDLSVSAKMNIVSYAGTVQGNGTRMVLSYLGLSS